MAEHEFDDLPVALHRADLDQRITAVSDAWLELLGYHREEVIGRPVAAFQTGAGEHALREAGPRLLAEGRIRELRLEFRRKDGTVLPLLLSSACCATLTAVPPAAIAC